MCIRDRRIGATWIEPSDYQDFMQETLHTPWYLLQKEIPVSYTHLDVYKRQDEWSFPVTAGRYS